MYRRIVLGTVVVVGLIVAALAEGVGADTSNVASETAASDFVGTWRVAVTLPDGSIFPVLSSYMADGTTLHDGPASQPALPGSSSAINFGTTGYGVWEVTGPEDSAVTFETMSTDEHGQFLGRQTINGVQTLDAGGHSFSGRYTITVTGPSGEVLATIPTTATAERIQIQNRVPDILPEATSAP